MRLQEPFTNPLPGKRERGPECPKRQMLSSKCLIAKSDRRVNLTSNDQHIQGTVGQSTGDIDYEGDLRVDGNVLDGRTIRARGSIHVGGVVQAAQVTSGADLVAAGGILGRDKAQCIAEGGSPHRPVHRPGLLSKRALTFESMTQIENSNAVVAGGSIIMPTGCNRWRPDHRRRRHFLPERWRPSHPNVYRSRS